MWACRYTYTTCICNSWNACISRIMYECICTENVGMNVYVQKLKVQVGHRWPMHVHVSAPYSDQNSSKHGTNHISTLRKQILWMRCGTWIISSPTKTCTYLHKYAICDLGCNQKCWNAAGLSPDRTASQSMAKWWTCMMLHCVENRLQQHSFDKQNLLQQSFCTYY